MAIEFNPTPKRLPPNDGTSNAAVGVLPNGRIGINLVSLGVMLDLSPADARKFAEKLITTADLSDSMSKN